MILNNKLLKNKIIGKDQIRFKNYKHDYFSFGYKIQKNKTIEKWKFEKGKRVEESRRAREQT